MKLDFRITKRADNSFSSSAVQSSTTPIFDLQINVSTFKLLVIQLDGPSKLISRPSPSNDLVSEKKDWMSIPVRIGWMFVKFLTMSTCILSLT